jgi:hypothetical protein
VELVHVLAVVPPVDKRAEILMLTDANGED